jgi:uncharacterized protein with ATP-grasp and redox domains
VKTALDCIPCLVRQAIDAVRRLTPNTDVHRRVIREVLQWAGTIDLQQSPPALAQQMHRHLREATDSADPYGPLKALHNQLAWTLLPELEAAVAEASDPLAMAARLAIAGNVIDMGARTDISDCDVREAFQYALSEPFWGDLDDFRQVLAEARSILYLADNAGEIVFDRLLLAQLSGRHLCVAVRGAPVLNDATLQDARAARLDEMATLIDNGSDAPGTLLDDCSPAFREQYRRADLIIAKGQGNFESLNDMDKNVFFLFKIKCAMVADHVGKPEGTHMLMRSRAR